MLVMSSTCFAKMLKDGALTFKEFKENLILISS